jgi:hypothetical protein
MGAETTCAVTFKGKTSTAKVRLETSVLQIRGANLADAIFVGVSHPSDFARISAAKSAIKVDGAVWLIRPKGSADVSERAVMAAGKAAGLVDVKVVAFSTTHSALKFVIPVKDRSR